MKDGEVKAAKYTKNPNDLKSLDFRGGESRGGNCYRLPAVGLTGGTKKNRVAVAQPLRRGLGFSLPERELRTPQESDGHLLAKSILQMTRNGVLRFSTVATN